MTLARVLLGLLVVMWVVTFAAAFVPIDSEHPQGTAHPEFTTMRQGGSGAARHGPLLFLGWAFGALGIAFYVALMAFGTRSGSQRRAIAPWLGGGLAAFLGAWTWLVFLYRDFMTAGAGGLFLGFPLPTAAMLYVLFPASLVFTILYVVGYDRWVLSEEDEAAFERLLAEGKGPEDATERGR